MGRKTERSCIQVPLINNITYTENDPISKFVDALPCTEEVKNKNKDLLMRLIVTKHITVKYDNNKNIIKIFGVTLNNDGKVIYENKKNKSTLL